MCVCVIYIINIYNYQETDYEFLEHLSTLDSITKTSSARDTWWEVVVKGFVLEIKKKIKRQISHADALNRLGYDNNYNKYRFCSAQNKIYIVQTNPVTLDIRKELK